MTIRFTAQRDLPPAEYIQDLPAVEEACRYLSDSASRGNVIGFDTETSGLDWDGLGVETHYVCLADDRRRMLIPTSREHAINLRPLAPMLRETAAMHAGFNIIYDWNALYGHTKYVLRQPEPLHLKTCYAEGMKLWCLFDEEGEETYGARGLKARARRYINLPMSSFDSLLDKGGVLEAMQSNPSKTIEYATRDAWAHRSICLLGQRITEGMPWAADCPHCGNAMYEEDRRTRKWKCATHGWQEPARLTTMWDWHRERDVPYMHVLQMLQVRGLPVNWAKLREYIPLLKQACEEDLRRFQREASEALVARGGMPSIVNPKSPAQLGRWLYGDTDVAGNVIGLALPVLKKTKGGDPSTGVKTLKILRAKYSPSAMQSLLLYRERSKILSTYLVGLEKREFPHTGRIHGSFRPWAATGRLLSKGPNMQNFPARPLDVLLPPAISPPSMRELLGEGYGEEEAAELLRQPIYQPRKEKIDIRGCIEAPEGQSVVCADYSQLEVRLAAHESRCTELTRVINEGMDLHCYTAAISFHNVLAGAEYAHIYEAKQASDDDLAPQWGALWQGVSDPESYLHVRTAKLADLDEKRTRLSEGFAFFRDLREEASSQESLLMVLQQPDWQTRWASFRSTVELRHKELITFRKAAKPAIFGIFYGIGPLGLSVQITDASGLPMTAEEAKKLIYAIKEVAYPGIGQMSRRLEMQVRNEGHVRTAMLRYRHPAGIFSGDAAKRAKGVRQAGNFPIQGLASEIVQMAMLSIEADAEFRDYGAVMVNQVHDEIVALSPTHTAAAACARMVYLMESTHGLDTRVPITVTGKVASTWSEAK